MCCGYNENWSLMSTNSYYSGYLVENMQADQGKWIPWKFRAWLLCRIWLLWPLCRCGMAGRALEVGEPLGMLSQHIFWVTKGLLRAGREMRRLWKKIQAPRQVVLPSEVDPHAHLCWEGKEAVQNCLQVPIAKSQHVRTWVQTMPAKKSF